MMENYFGHVGWFGLGIGSVFGLLLWVLFIWAIVALVHSMTNRDGKNWHHDERRPKENRALDIIRERYARGEMSKEEFDKMRRDLE